MPEAMAPGIRFPRMVQKVLRDLVKFSSQPEGLFENSLTQVPPVGSPKMDRSFFIFLFLFFLIR